MKKVIIIGAGPAGLTAGFELLKKAPEEYSVTIYEESNAIGGISRTVRHKGNRMDIGGHRFFSKDKQVMQWWEEMMPRQGKPSFDDIILGREKNLSENGPDPEETDRVMLVRNRVSRIYYKKKFFDYPVSLKWDTIKNMGFDALIPAINAGNIDVAIAGMSITPDRQKAVDMSDPYYVSGLVVVVGKDNAAVKSVNDLNNKGIAVQIGTTGAERAAKVPGAKVKNFNTNAEVFLELKNKGVEAVIIDKPVAEYFLATGGGKDYAKIVGDTMEAESYGISLKKNSPLTKEINKALLDLKKNGEYDKLYAKWFGAVKK